MNNSDIVVRLLNAIHTKDEVAFRSCFSPLFQDVLPNGTIVKSAAHLFALHIHFMNNALTGFRPFDRKRTGNTSPHRPFTREDFDFYTQSFFRVAAEVDRPADFRFADSPIERRYMHLGILVEGGSIAHIQNTLFDIDVSEPS